MDSAPKIALYSASTSAERMDELEKFIVFWLGPRQPEYGEPEEVLEKMKLPAPLRRLHAFGGRWPRKNPTLGQTECIWANQDGLRRAQDLEHKDGKVLFVTENSGNWDCATLPEGDDPPVWVDDDCIGGYNQGKWALISESLSKFLATFCLQELAFASRLCLADNNIYELYKDIRKESVPLIRGPYPYAGVDSDIRLLLGCVLVSETGLGTWFGANHENGIQFLKEHQGKIIEVCLGVSGSWHIRFCPDGSGEVVLPSWSNSIGRIPTGSFDFVAIRDQLLAAAPEVKSGWERPWYACFARSGQSSSRGMAVKDVGLARMLFRNAIAAVTSKESAFDELLKKFPPPMLGDDHAVT